MRICFVRTDKYRWIPTRWRGEGLWLCVHTCGWAACSLPCGSSAHSGHLSCRSKPVHTCVSASLVQWALHSDKLSFSPQMLCCS